jgi:hypothetical protein
MSDITIEKTEVTNNFAVDLVILIDATGSMNPVIEQVKINAIKLYSDCKEHMNKIQKNIDSLRVKVIVYRDYYCDETPMKVSSFFNLPEQAQDLEDFIMGIEADGGGDEPESGLEALSLAIDSDWNKSPKARHVIALWTDASAHPFEVAGKEKPSSYPTNMPKDLMGLTSKWGQNMNNTAKRFLLFAPDVFPWSLISSDWDSTIHHPAKAGEGLRDVDYKSILETIANSI